MQSHKTENSISYALKRALGELPDGQTLWVGYSGGVDSHVLLHALATQFRNNFQLGAVHINHGLHADALLWEKHCQKICQALAIPCHVLRVDAVAHKGESPEAAARAARYSALQTFLKQNDYLLFAHHLDDQAETLLLQLLRGAGIAGLASMPEQSNFAAGILLRPLLEVSRDEISAYAQEHQLHWIDDPGNENLQFDRNFLRRHILPLLAQRWPATKQTLARSARHCGSAVNLLQEIAYADLKLVQQKNDTLSISLLEQLSEARRNNVVRFWLQQKNLPVPNEKHLRQLITDVLHCTEDASPLVTWSGAEIRRYRDFLYAMPPLLAHDSNVQIPWNFQEDLLLPAQMGTLMSVQVLGKGVSAALLHNASCVTVRFRQGGESCYPTGRVGSHPLKKMLQEWDVPPWLRERIPLIYADEKLAAVVGYCVSDEFITAPDELGWQFELL